VVNTHNILFFNKKSTLAYTLYLTPSGDDFLKRLVGVVEKLTALHEKEFLSSGCQFWLYHSSNKRSDCSLYSKSLLRASYAAITI
jgi:hypothetical protein